MQRRHLLMLLVLASLWGASFMFIKIGDRELDPLLLVGIRMALGALTLVPIVLVRFGARETARELRRAAGRLTVTGLVNSAIPIFSITWAETRIDSGLTAIIQASAPLFTALLAVAFVQAERVTGARLVGLAVGFGGVAMLVGVQPKSDAVAGLAVVFSALCYAIAALWTSRRMRDVSPLVMSLGALTAASVATLPAGLTRLPDRVPSGGVIAAMLALGIAGTGLAYILYYSVLTSAGASRGILITYLVPAVALAYGVVLLGEPLTVAAVAGLALVLAGVSLGTGAVRIARTREAPVIGG
jgi:drug/metabolite transporter (DMT)-like permease